MTLDLIKFALRLKEWREAVSPRYAVIFKRKWSPYYIKKSCICCLLFIVIFLPLRSKLRVAMDFCFVLLWLLLFVVVVVYRCIPSA